VTDAALGTPYWWETGRPAPEFTRRPPETTDIAIIGAGYTGLSAAITAAQSGARVVVFEKGVPGQGASTRNGGMCGAHTRISYGAMVKSFGEEVAQAIVRESPNAFAFVRRLIAENDLDCDFQSTGRIQLAYSRKDFDQQKKLAEEITGICEMNLDVVEQADLARHINSPVYFGGLYYKDHGGLNPRKFHDELIRLALEAGVVIIANCTVRGWAKRKGSYGLGTSKGRIRSDQIILATNGYTDENFRWFQSYVFPLPSFIIATEQLPPEVINEIAPGARMMVESRAKHSYFRISPDGTRVLFGGRAGMIPFGPKFAAKRLRATMVEIWPQLMDVEITHSWRGNTGFTFEQMPHVGVHEGVHFAMGFSGSGVAMAPYLGMKVAYRALGDERGKTAFASTKMTTRWFHFSRRPLFLLAAEIWYRQVVDRLETRQNRKDRSQSDQSQKDR
jgi:glycine/D-amino acid oxidase-like deaminating enzyme